MKQPSGPARKPAEALIKDIHRATRRQFSSEEKIRIVLEGLRGEDSIAELCRREGIASSMYDGWSNRVVRRRHDDDARHIVDAAEVLQQTVHHLGPVLDVLAADRGAVRDAVDEQDVGREQADLRAVTGLDLGPFATLERQLHGPYMPKVKIK